jgi:hypothetical protein
VRSSVALADSASFFDGALFVLLLIATAALIWTMLSAKVREPLNAFTCVLAIATIGLAIVSFLQWRTLDITDETWRAGERAFVFLKQNDAQWQPAQTADGGIVRFFPVVWENSGNSPTSRLIFETHCPLIQQSVAQNPTQLPGNSSGLVHKLLGPKQSIWSGECGYFAESLNFVRDKGYHLYITSTADYYDISDAHHRTEACFEIVGLSGNFEDLQAVPHNSFTGCGRNCADKECDKL